MRSSHRVLRVFGELLGGAFALFVLAYAALLSTMMGWLGLVYLFGGYLLLPPGLRLLSRLDLHASLRASVDAGLVALLPTTALIVAAIEQRWPLRGRRSDMHGFGFSGGELNLAFFSLLHVALSLALIALWTRCYGRRTRA